VRIENMAVVASLHGILVDEDRNKCQTAKRMANEIISKISDTATFKNEHLPLQGIRKQLCHLEKEKCRGYSPEITHLQTKEEILIERLK